MVFYVICFTSFHLLSDEITSPFTIHTTSTGLSLMSSFHIVIRPRSYDRLPFIFYLISYIYRQVTSVFFLHDYYSHYCFNQYCIVY